MSIVAVSPVIAGAGSPAMIAPIAGAKTGMMPAIVGGKIGMIWRADFGHQKSLGSLQPRLF